jgi:hypothetical protein
MNFIKWNYNLISTKFMMSTLLLAGLLFDLKSELMFLIRWNIFVSRIKYENININ